MRRRIVCGLATAVAVAFCYLKPYDISPTHYALSGKTDTIAPNNYVAETFIAPFDSAAEAWCFIGEVGNPGNTYDVEIKDIETDAVVAHSYGVVAPAKGYTWLQFPMTPVTLQKIVRGKEYKVVVTRPGGQINWFKNTTDAFAFGHMEGGGDTLPTANDDLCMKLFGKARVGDEFATQSNVAWKADSAHETIPYTPPDSWDFCIAREVEVGVKYDKIGYGFWGLIQRTGNTRWEWYWLDQLMMSFATHRIRPIMSFRGSPRWATCAYSNTGQPNGAAIPSNLWKPVLSGNSINDSNYYAKYIYEFVRRYGPKGYSFNDSLSGTFWRLHGGYDTLPIRLFEGFPETPLCGIGNPRYDSPYVYKEGYWRLIADPYSNDSVVDPAYRDTIAHHIQINNGDTLAGRKSSLAAAYARLMIVVDSAVKLAYEQRFPSDPVRAQSVAYISDDGMYGMSDWLTRLKTYGADTCFDVASCWNYAEQGHPEQHVSNFLWMRDQLHDAGYAPRNMLFTEFGCELSPCTWQGRIERAYHLCKTYALMQAANAAPGYSALADAWFTFTEQYMPYQNWVITGPGPTLPSWPEAYAYEQWSGLTKDADFDGRVLCGDSIFLYQFEDTLKKKFWITWAAVSGQVPSTVGIPARSDTIDSMSTATDSAEHEGSQTCAVSGWLSATPDTIPLIVIERPDASRPDMTVDSIWCTPDADEGQPVVFHARLRNHGTDSTPIGLRTYVRFYIEGELVRQAFYSPPIPAGETVTVSADTAIQLPVPLPLLVRATANEEQLYVELGMDDNAGYFKCGTGP